jgi:predicted transcriptional regulator
MTAEFPANGSASSNADDLCARVLDILKGLPESVKGLIAETIRNDARPKKPKPGLQFKPLEREEIKLECVRLSSMGFSNVRIARDLGISHDSVGNYIEDTKRAFRESIVDFRKDLAIQELNVLMAVRQKAYEGLLRSEEGIRSESRRTGFGEDGRPIDETTETHTQVLPPSQYLSIILQTNARICAMFDVDEMANQMQVNVAAVTGSAMLEAIAASVAQRAPSKLDQLEAIEASQKSDRTSARSI